MPTQGVVKEVRFIPVNGDQSTMIQKRLVDDAYWLTPDITGDGQQSRGWFYIDPDDGTLIPAPAQWKDRPIAEPYTYNGVQTFRGIFTGGVYLHPSFAPSVKEQGYYRLDKRNWPMDFDSEGRVKKIETFIPGIHSFKWNDIGAPMKESMAIAFALSVLFVVLYLITALITLGLKWQKFGSLGFLKTSAYFGRWMIVPIIGLIFVGFIGTGGIVFAIAGMIWGIYKAASSTKNLPDVVQISSVQFEDEEASLAIQTGGEPVVDGPRLKAFGGLTDQLSELKQMQESGVIEDEEYRKLRKGLIDRASEA